MQCPAPLPEEARTPLLTTLLVEEPHVVVPKGPKTRKGRAGLRTWET